MIDRKIHMASIQGLLKRLPVVAMLGARQIGKTTLTSAIAAEYPTSVTRFDLEKPSDLARLQDRHTPHIWVSFTSAATPSYPS